MEREREIEVAGHWLIFILILGMVLSMSGMAGWIIGYAYADPSQAAAHSILHPIARVSVILGPAMLFIGAAMFLGSIYGIHGRQKTPPHPVAPMRFKGFNPLAHTAMDEEEAEEEAIGQGLGLRTYHGRSPEKQGISSNA